PQSDLPDAFVPGNVNVVPRNGDGRSQGRRAVRAQNDRGFERYASVRAAPEESRGVSAALLAGAGPLRPDRIHVVAARRGPRGRHDWIRVDVVAQHLAGTKGQPVARAADREPGVGTVLRPVEAVGNEHPYPSVLGRVRLKGGKRELVPRVVE